MSDGVEHAPPGSEDCPYPGLAAFGPQEAEWFFGRDQAINDLIRKLAEPPGGGVPLTVLAPSGAGTSSLLAAGLVPALAGGKKLPGSESWPRLVITLGADPLSDLATQVAEQTGADPAAATTATADQQRFTDFLTEKVAAHGRKQGQTSSLTRVVLIVDQFEKTFTVCQEDAKRLRLIAALCTAAQNDAVLVVLGLRADFYGSYLAAYEQLRQLRPAWPPPEKLLSMKMTLKPMSHAQLREIITEPAKAKDHEVASDLIDRLLSDLGATDAGLADDQGVLPLLAHVLRETWKRRSGLTLTVADYEPTGGIARMLADTAEMVYGGLGEPEQQIIAAQILPCLVQVDAQPGDACRPVPRARLLRALRGATDAIEKVLEAFGQARVLTFDNDDGAGSVKITHKALPQTWARLAGWMSADRVWLHTYRSLCEAAAAWEDSGRKADKLARDVPLADFQKWAVVPGHKARLSDSQAKYLDDSIDQNKNELQARRRRRRMVGRALLAVVVLLAVGILVHQYNTERTQRDLALASKLAATSRTLAAEQPYAAMLLAVEAFHLAPVPETRDALLSTQSQSLRGHLADKEAGHVGFINAALFIDEGRTLATAGEDGTVRLWDVAGHRPHPPLESRAAGLLDVEFGKATRIVTAVGRDGTVWRWNLDKQGQQQISALRTSAPSKIPSAATLSHQSGMLAIGSDDGSTQIWDIERELPVVTFSGHNGPVYGAEFSPNDEILVTTGADGTVRLWDAANKYRPIDTLPGHTAGVKTAAFSLDGRILVTGSHDRTARLWDVASRRQIATLADHTDDVTTAAFSPDGRILVTGSRDRTARLWDVVTHQKVSIIPGTSPILGVAFSPDGHTVATVGQDEIAKLWDTGDPILLPFPAAVGYDVIFRSDGRVLVIADDDGTARLWEVAGRRHIATLTGHTGAVYAVAFSPDERILATASADGTARLWDAVNYQPLVTFDGHAGAIRNVAFNHDGLLVTAGNDGVARLWDAVNSRPINSQPIATFDGHAGAIRSVAFSPDGSILATAGDDAAVRLWDTANRQHITTLIGHTDSINKVVFSPNGHILATAGDDATAQLWDTAQLRETVQHRPIGTLTGHAGIVHTVAFNREGLTLVTASNDGMAKLWNVESRQLIATLTDHTDAIYGVGFNPDGLLATVGGDRTVRLWDLNADRVLTRICEIIRPVSRAQWDQLIPELDYQPTCR